MKKSRLVEDAKALALITLSIKTELLINIKHCVTSKEAWDKLEKLYNRTGKKMFFVQAISSLESQRRSVDS